MPAQDNVVLVGTAHVSRKSVRDVESAIQRHRPDIVAVELCQRRYDALQRKQVSREQFSVRKLVTGGNVYALLVQWVLAYLQRKLAQQYGIEPGAEMVAAMDAAKARGIPVALVDRDIGVTMQRFLSKMRLREKVRMFFGLVAYAFGLVDDEEVDVERITDRDMVTALVDEFRSFSPGAAEALIDERDAYIAGRLRELGEHQKVVAVVGAGHLDGVRRFLAHPELIPPRAELEAVPKKRFSALKLVGYAFVAAVLAVFALLFLSGEPWDVILVSLGLLFLTQGLLAALAVLLVRGHPFSALTALGLAWFGFLNPVLSVGMFAALVEAYVRPPSYDDLAGMAQAQTLRELFRNRLFKVILIAAVASLGSMVGTFLALPLILGYVHISNPIDIIVNAFARWL